MSMRAKKTQTGRMIGSAIVLLLLAIVMLLVIGVGLLNLGWNSRLLAIRGASDIAARSAADAGLTKALFEANHLLETKSWHSAVLPYATNESLPNSDGVFSYKVVPDGNTSYSVQSTGRSGRSTKMVNAVLQLKGLFEYAVFTRDGVLLRNGTSVDGYNYSAAGETLQIGTNSTAAGSMIMKTGVTVYGDVIVGAGGTPETVINSKKEAVITGETYPLIEKQDLPPVIVPGNLQTMASSGTLTTSTTITAPARKYDGINVGNSDIIKIDSPVVLYVVGDLILNNSAQVQIGDGTSGNNACLTLYLGGTLECKNGGFINNLSKSPSKLKIFGLPTCQSIDLKTASKLYGAIYAPDADVRSHNSVEVYGSVVGKNFIQDVYANLHYDASLRKVSAADLGVRFVIQRWSED